MSEKVIECPFCGFECEASILLRERFLNEGNAGNYYRSGDRYYIDFHANLIEAQVLACANVHCKKESLWIVYMDSNKEKIIKRLVPKSGAKPQPDCVPKEICEDYEEACLVLEDSPKASAALARRCLQAMIHDFHDIKENTLHEEIMELFDQSKISQDTKEVLLGMKGVGNAAAHPDRLIDVSKEDASALLKWLEILFDEWYVERNEKEERERQMKELGEKYKKEKSDDSTSKGTAP